MSRQKGVRAELEVCKILSRAWGGKFRRSGPGFEGEDILTPKDFPHHVEVKDRADIKLKHLFKPHKALRDCIKQAVSQAEPDRYGVRLWLLAIKMDGIWIAVVPFLGRFLGLVDYMRIPGIDAMFFPLEKLCLPREPQETVSGVV